MFPSISVGFLTGEASQGFPNKSALASELAPPPAAIPLPLLGSTQVLCAQSGTAGSPVVSDCLLASGRGHFHFRVSLLALAPPCAAKRPHHCCPGGVLPFNPHFSTLVASPPLTLGNRRESCPCQMEVRGRRCPSRKRGKAPGQILTHFHSDHDHWLIDHHHFFQERTGRDFVTAPKKKVKII